MKLSTDLLKPDPANARKISDRALDGLAVSTETFGDLSGIVWNEKLGLLVAGHQRMRVLRAMGATEWVRERDTAYIVHPKTGERFRIRVVQWDETTHRMAELTANNENIQGEYTDDLTQQLRDLSGQAGFESLQLADLQKQVDKDLKAAAAAAAAADQSGDLRQSFAIIIECGSEGQQLELLGRFQGEGLACRALS